MTPNPKFQVMALFHIEHLGNNTRPPFYHARLLLDFNKISVSVSVVTGKCQQELARNLSNGAISNDLE